MTHVKHLVLAAASVALAACGGSDTVVRDRTDPTPTPAPTAAPTPEPTPAATATPEPAANRAPRVALTGGGSCHPRVGRPCTVEFQVDARDPDGDRLTLEWSGCTSGSGLTESCTVDRPGEHTATVVATDVHGARSRASAVAQGVNRPPTVRIGTHGRPPDPAPPNTFFAIIGGQEARDPDDFPPEYAACSATRLTVSGPCSAGIALCGGVDDSLDLDLTTRTGPGTCVVEAVVTDPWGAVGRDRMSFAVRP